MIGNRFSSSTSCSRWLHEPEPDRFDQAFPGPFLKVAKPPLARFWEEKSLCKGELTVFVCYLDDSGKDRENPITTLAGYVAMEAAWTLFERNVEPVFKEFGVEILHTKDLHDTKGEFKLWSRDMKEKFVSRVCEVMAQNVLLGISVSVDKEIYQVRREESRAKGVEKISPYNYCFRVLWDRLLSDRNSWVSDEISQVRDAIRAEGVSFILECGHENNAEVQQGFQEVRQRHKLEGVPGSVSFHAKQDSRAIQLADLYAYYSRRQVKWIEEHPHQTPERDPILAILPKAVSLVVKDVSD